MPKKRKNYANDLINKKKNLRITRRLDLVIKNIV